MSKKGQADRNKRGQSQVITFPDINAYPSRHEWERSCWQKLIRSPNQLDLIATHYERRVFVLRAAVAHRLKVGKTYQAIGEELWLSPQTISTIKKGIREARYRSYADRGKTERKKKVYSVDRRPRRAIKIGMPRKTKYGTVYL